MNKTVKRTLISLLGIVGLVVVAAAVFIGPPIYRAVVGLHRYETVPPVLPAGLKDTAVLLFSKTNGYRHDDAIKASNDALAAIAERRGWSVFVTENGAVFNPEQLKRFKAVVWNNASGDVLTDAQREAFKSYLEAGGGFVGIHAAGDNSHHAWAWYMDTLIGAHFIGHTLRPQFPEATVHIEDHANPATHDLGDTWTRADEWYSFSSSPRTKGYHVLATLDESTYRPVMNFPIVGGTDIHMGDHPIVWVHCVGKGRAFYSAMGHTASSYGEPDHLRLLEGAMAWAAGLEGTGCE
jgi:type 1 glutamine amidotransferase